MEAENDLPIKRVNGRMWQTGESGPAPPATRGLCRPIAAPRPRAGRIQTKIRRVLIAAGKPLSTVELAKRVYARPTQLGWRVSSIYRAAPRFAVPIARGRTGLVWRLK
jgi:hypothetical protein